MLQNKQQQMQEERKKLETKDGTYFLKPKSTKSVVKTKTKMAEVRSIKVIDINSIKMTRIKMRMIGKEMKQHTLQYLHVVNLVYRQFIFY